MPAACNACEGIGTSINVKPSRISETGDEGMEARGREGCEDSHPLPRQLHGSPMVPGTPDEHRPLLQTSALGLCEGQEILHSHKITFLIISRFQYGKENAFGLCPQLCHSHVSMLLRQGARGWSPRRAHVGQEWRGRAIGHLSEPAPGQSLHLPTEHGRARRQG